MVEERGRGKCELVFAVHAETNSNLKPGELGEAMSSVDPQISH